VSDPTVPEGFGRTAALSLVSRRRKPRRGQLLVAALMATAVPVVASPQEARYSYNLYGVPGLIDMPTAEMAEDAEFATTTTYFAGSNRTTLTFQITPRLSGSFRYSSIDNWVLATNERTFDRSFDIRYRFIDEGRYRPAVAVGLQDFIGTGIYAAEYIVATKHVGPKLTLTGGIGWGRLGSYKGFTNPLGVLDDGFETRPARGAGLGGEPEADQWFRGDAAVFAGLSYQATDRLTFKAEYSSDAYVQETRPGRDLFERKSPFNFGVDYAIAPGFNGQLYYLYGSEIGAGVTITLNPRKPTVAGGLGISPTPVMVRAPGAAADLGWTAQADGKPILRDNVQKFLANEGLALEALEIEPYSATLFLRPGSYISTAEAVGRAGRILTQTMPASIETFNIVPMRRGIPASTVTLRRSDLEELENTPDAAWQSYARAQIGEGIAPGDGALYADDLYPRFRWNLGPYIAASYFDPDSPVRIDLGLQANASYTFAPGLTLSGSVRKKVVGNRDQSQRVAVSALPQVRSNSNRYNAQGDPAITDLTLAYHFRIAPEVYGRVTVGYLERMFGGISTEVLWKPVDSRFALGAELNYVKQRDFDQLFGFQNYDVATGHVSAYYDIGNGFHGQVDVGRYLAGDWGTTITLDREFANGWRIGAYATFTDVSAADFGEGSFDKGLRFTVPLQHFLGTPTRRTYSSSIQPVLRDGGARLNVQNRLYNTVRDAHEPELRKSWGRFWR
jgi:hypothetical protein